MKFEKDDFDSFGINFCGKTHSVDKTRRFLFYPECSLIVFYAVMIKNRYHFKFFLLQWIPKAFEALSLVHWGSPRNKFAVKVGILSHGGEGSHPIPTFSNHNHTKGWFCWDFVAIWGGFPSPNQKSHQNSPITKIRGLFHEEIICLE